MILELTSWGDELMSDQLFGYWFASALICTDHRARNLNLKRSSTILQLTASRKTQGAWASDSMLQISRDAAGRSSLPHTPAARLSVGYPCNEQMLLVTISSLERKQELHYNLEWREKSRIVIEWKSKTKIRISNDKGTVLESAEAAAAFLILWEGTEV